MPYGRHCIAPVNQRIFPQPDVVRHYVGGDMRAASAPSRLGDGLRACRRCRGIC